MVASHLHTRPFSRFTRIMWSKMHTVVLSTSNLAVYTRFLLIIKSQITKWLDLPPNYCGIRHQGNLSSYNIFFYFLEIMTIMTSWSLSKKRRNVLCKILPVNYGYFMAVSLIIEVFLSCIYRNIIHSFFR